MGFRPLTSQEREVIEISLRRAARGVSAVKVVAEVAAAVETAVEAAVDAVTPADEAVEAADAKPTGKNPFKKKP